MAEVISPPSALSAVSTNIISTIPISTVAAVATQLASVPSDGLFAWGTLGNILLWLATFVSIRLPTWLFALFSTSLTFTLNFTTLTLIVLAFASLVSWIVRYRYLNMYTRLPPEPQRKEPQIDLFPEARPDDAKPGLANYLDEFLSAIKVFGYLERPVFHELTRTMQTRKLIAGETFMLEEEKGYCLVVDGLVQIFVKSNREASKLDLESLGNDDEEEEERLEGHQGYQLLTEVKNGAPMSSLFSILSLFTEDIELRHETDEAPVAVRSAGLGFLDGRATGSMPGSPGKGPTASLRRYSQRNTRPRQISHLPKVPSFNLDGRPNPQHTAAESLWLEHRGNPRPSKSVHPDIVARAVVDTTIAVIPATAFRRLTRVYPKATAHIVQVILTRLQRVTLATAHNYLGLTTEVLQTEKQMNKYTSYDLPNHLRGSALERLKDKFTREIERLDSKEIAMGIALHNPTGGRRQSNASLLKDLIGKPNATRTSEALRGMTKPSAQSGISAGDLMGNHHTPRPIDRLPALNSNPTLDLTGPDVPQHKVTSPLLSDAHPPFPPATNGPIPLHRQESLEEDAQFRRSILTCITKAIGLAHIKSTKRGLDSVDASPRMVSYDSVMQTATFTNAFGFIDPYDASADGDSESIISTGTGPGNPSIQDDLADEVEIVYFPKGAVLVEEGERNPGLYYVIDGFLDVTVPIEGKKGTANVDSLDGHLPPLAQNFTDSSSGLPGSAHVQRRKKGPRRSLFMIKPGGLAGYVGTISSFRSFIDVRAKTDVYVGFLPRASLERIVEKFPVVLLTMAKRLTSLLPRLILHIDFALEWVQIDAGEVIYNQGDESDAIYIVLNGRLRAVAERTKDDQSVVGEYGQGESVGELEVMTESLRPASLHAIRDTELAKFPKGLFNSLALEHPGITIKISKIIAQRMRAIIEDPTFEHGKDNHPANATKNVTSTLNLRTIAVMPVMSGVPVVEFGTRLLSALSQLGVVNGVASLNQAAILNHLGRHAFSRMGKLKLAQYLADLEERYGMLLYVADTNVTSPWTQTCVAQADCVLLVGLADDSPSIGNFERFLLGMKTTARKELVLLHAERFCPSGLTRKWLRNRPWINGGHHHIQMTVATGQQPARPMVQRFGTVLKQRVQVLQAEIQKYTSRRIRQTPLYSAETPFKGDFHRLARRLCGKSIGLVLGGGGARGIAHIGIIRALEEAGIPIDIVGGTSIGSFIGALYARDADVVPMYGRAKKFAGRLGSMWRFALDLTYPAVAYTTGHEFNRGIYKTFGNSQIEDFWLEFYCNTTNLSRSRSEFHSSGYVWRYVRASMSLAGLLPPLCDEGSLLLDGGYIDNLTVSHMRALGADTVFAVDVGAVDDASAAPQRYGDSLSGLWVLLHRWNPWAALPAPPSLSEIQARLAYVSSVDALAHAKRMPGCLYLRPPIDAYGTLEFARFDEIYQVGYRFGVEYLAGLRNQGVLPLIEETEEKRNLRRTMAPRRASI